MHNRENNTMRMGPEDEERKKALLPFLIGMGVFSLLVSFFMILQRDDEVSTPVPLGGPWTSMPYPYNPADPTEGGKYPNPNDPSLPIVILPPGQGGGNIFPIFPVDIIYDPIDSMRQVVSNRLNVLLEKKDENTGREFMAEFKRLYPSQEYSFNYFDTLSYRLQMTIPPNRRAYFKDNLNAQMPKFDFLLFDEEVFSFASIPTDPGFADKNKSWYFDAINVHQAWETTKGDSNIIVAVVDNGFDLNHPEFKGKIVAPINIPEKNSHVFPIIEKDGSDHGTHVASTAIGHLNNYEGVSGIAPGCRFMPVQVATADGMMPNSIVMDGVLYAIYKGASVVNVSLGPVPPEWFKRLSAQQQQMYIKADDKRLSKVWERIYHIANKHNCTIVISAGNENILSGYSSRARTDTVIVVSAVNEMLQKASFSNYGNFRGWKTNYSTVSAPGVHIYNAINNGHYTSMQGTSMASPIVAGTVALMKSVNPKLKTEDVRQILQQSGRPLNGEPIGPFLQADKAIEIAKNWPHKTN